MILYAICHKRTREYIVDTRQRNKTAAKLSKQGIPRLFSTKSGAKQSLKWWVKGEWYHIYNPSTTYEEANHSLMVDEVYGRRLEDMEIVEVTLTFSNFNTVEQLRMQKNNAQLIAWLREKI